MADEDDNFGGFLVLDFRKWWGHVQAKNFFFFFFLFFPGTASIWAAVYPRTQIYWQNVWKIRKILLIKPHT